MAARLIASPLILACLLSVFCFTGCSPMSASGPDFGLLNFPVPVSPYWQKREEDKFWNHERYARAPVLEPITADSPPVALDPPSPDEVMRALERARPVEGGVPFLSSLHRDNVQITTELISDYIDPPRFYPLVGPAQMHHCHYKCTVYFTETKRLGYPLPYTTRDEDCVEVIYIDHDHLHRVGGDDEVNTVAHP